MTPDRVLEAWRNRQRLAAALRLADRQLGQVMLAAEKAGVDLRQLPASMRYSSTAQLEAARHAERVPRGHVDAEGRELRDVLDSYGAGLIGRDEAMEMLTQWPYRGPANELEGMPDTFAQVEAAADAGILSPEDLDEIRRLRRGLG